MSSQVRPDGDGMRGESHDNAMCSGPNTRKSALPLLGMEKTAGGIALGRKARGITCAFRFEMHTRSLR